MYSLKFILCKLFYVWENRGIVAPYYLVVYFFHLYLHSLFFLHLSIGIPFRQGPILILLMCFQGPIYCLAHSKFQGMFIKWMNLAGNPTQSRFTLPLGCCLFYKSDPFLCIKGNKNISQRDSRRQDKSFGTPKLIVVYVWHILNSKDKYIPNKNQVLIIPWKKCHEHKTRGIELLSEYPGLSSLVEI